MRLIIFQREAIALYDGDDELNVDGGQTGHFCIEGIDYPDNVVPYNQERIVGKPRVSFVTDDGKRHLIIGAVQEFNPLKMMWTIRSEIDWKEFAIRERLAREEIDEQIVDIWGRIRKLESREHYDDFGGIFNNEEE